MRESYKNVLQATRFAELSVRPRRMGELKVCDEQLCTTCMTYQPRFLGSRMKDGSKSTFTQCLGCRNGKG